MVTKKSVASEIISLSSIKGMVEAYEEIAAMRINRTQDAVLKSRVFTQEINDIFQHVKSSAKKEIARIMKIKKIKDRKNLSFLEKNGKTLFVYLSSNTGLYGDIIKRTFDLFAKYVDGLSDNVVIIGKLGLKIASERGISQPITYFDFPDNSVDEAQLQKIAAYLIGFERVIVFYGLFDLVLVFADEFDVKHMVDIRFQILGVSKSRISLVWGKRRYWVISSGLMNFSSMILLSKFSVLSLPPITLHS